MDVKHRKLFVPHRIAAAAAISIALLSGNSGQQTATTAERSPAASYLNVDLSLNILIWIKQAEAWPAIVIVLKRGTWRPVHI
jgi:hypothetical protein